LERTRILLVDLPRMLHEIIRTTLEEQPDMEVVDTTGSASDIDTTNIDVVISGHGGLLAPRVLRQRAGIRVFALSASGKESLLFELRPHRIALGEVSPAQVVAAIRGWRPDGGTPGASTQEER
jgi:hypothetical protein